MQIAVVLDDEVVNELDRLVPTRFRSRAEAVRCAVHSWLAAEAAKETDRRYVKAYTAAPQTTDNIDETAGNRRRIPEAWSDLEW